MSKKANSSIYHLKKYIQIQKLKCVLKIGFSNDEITPRVEKIKTHHAIEMKWALEFTVRSGYLLCSLREDTGINF